MPHGEGDGQEKSGRPGKRFRLRGAFRRTFAAVGERGAFASSGVPGTLRRRGADTSTELHLQLDQIAGTDVEQSGVAAVRAFHQELTARVQ